MLALQSTQAPEGNYSELLYFVRACYLSRPDSSLPVAATHGFRGQVCEQSYDILDDYFVKERYIRHPDFHACTPSTMEVLVSAAATSRALYPWEAYF
ncbi:hypothetical protein C8Q70DRAFT_417940 [Cubamyces menziesii]|nr:hypothetical protein C8Q70DRAFT_417940 [Cubamyces menziesii]